MQLALNRHAKPPVQEFTYISPSRCADRSLADLKPHVDAYWDKLDPDHNDGEGAESFADLLRRAKAFLADAATRPGVGVVFTVHAYRIVVASSRLQFQRVHGRIVG